jgi:peroxiredoxin
MILLVIALVVGWMLAALASVLVYRLMVERGQFLLRIERLEQRFAEVGPETGPPGLQDHGLPVGAPAPDFELSDLAGTQHALSEWRDTPLLLIFFDPQCHFSAAMVPELSRALREQRADRVVPLVVTTGDVDANRRMLTEAGIDCQVLRQEGAEVASLFRSRVTPSAHLIDEHRVIAAPLALGAEEVLALLREPLGRSANGVAPSASAGAPSVSNRLRSVAESKLTRSGLTVGMPAPAFSLPRVGGGELSLAAYEGRRVLLVFSDPACVPCDALAPKLERLHRRRDDMHIVMVSRGTLEDNLAKAAQHNLTFPIALQRHWEVSRAYGMFATPIAYLIDEHGILESEVAVGADPILELAAGRQARTAQRKEATAHR